MRERVVQNAATTPAVLRPTARQDRQVTLLAESGAVPPRMGRARLRSRQDLLRQLAQFFKAVAVTRRGGVGRDVKRFRDLDESQTTPDLQRDHFAVNVR